MTQRDIIAVGGSMGSVEAVRYLCANLSSDLAASVFIVIHIGAQGKNLLAGILAANCSLPVHTAVDGETVQHRHLYVAPADHHMLVINDVIRLGRGPRENMTRPAIDPLFRSIAVNYGPRAIGVVLTGMLNDGAAGLADMKRCGAVTVVQNPSDAQAPSMPLGALENSEVDYRTQLVDLPDLLMQLSLQPAGVTIDVPENIRLEVDIALGHGSDMATLARLGSPIAMSCPACGGVLSQIERRQPLRFRCQVGHAYTAEALVTAKEGSVDEAMRVALRIIEERVLLNEKMADDARRSGRLLTADANDERARQLDKHAKKLRSAVAKSE